MNLLLDVNTDSNVSILLWIVGILAAIALVIWIVLALKR